MKRKYVSLLAIIGLAAFLFGPSTAVAQQSLSSPSSCAASCAFLATACSFAVLGGSSVTNASTPTIVNGNLGLSPGTTVTGFPPGIVTGTIHIADAVSNQARNDAITAFNNLAGEPTTANLTGQDLGGLTLTPGVYRFNSAAQLTGALTLDAGGNPNARFDFQIGSTLTTATASSVVVINGGLSCNVFWQVGTSATLGSGTRMPGTILALTNITLNTRAGVAGDVLAINGFVMLDNNTAAPDARPDVNGDGKSDIVLRNSSTGDIAEYLMNGTTITSGVIAGNAGTTYSIATVGDYNGDGKADLALQNSSTNDIAVWLMNGSTLISGVLVGNPGAGWKAVASADFNGDGKSDILLDNEINGNVAVWLMNGGTITGGAVIGTPGLAYRVVAAADFNGDGKADILLQNTTTGDMAMWAMSGTSITGGLVIGGAGPAWQAKAAADANSDGKADIFLRNQNTGDVALWLMSGFTILSGAVVGSPGAQYDLIGSGDYNGDGKADILLRNQTSGDLAIWLLNGTTITGGAVVATPGSNWTAVAH